MRKYAGMPPERVIRRVLERLDRSGGPEACWPCKGSRLPHGYVQIGWSENGTVGGDYAHRIVLAHTLQRPLAPGEEALHQCDNPPCGNPAHIFLGTQQDNCKDMAQKNRSTQGERNPASRLSSTEIQAIRQDQRPSWSVALDYGVTARQVRKIRQGVQWKHVA
jgi:hypothetical protein